MLINNLWLIFSMAWTIALANIIGAAICLSFANKINRMALLPGDYLFPEVRDPVRRRIFFYAWCLGDVVIAPIFGFVGYGMKKYSWSRPVMIIGLVLAKIA